MSTLDETIAALGVLGDPTRVRLLALLQDEELTVAELTQCLALGQSRVSTHLGRLRDAGLVRDRRQGSSIYYAMAEGSATGALRRLWGSVHGEMDDALLAADQGRREEVLRARDGEPAWPDAFAGQMERHYSPGRTWASTLAGVLPFVALGDVLDVGSGDGVVAQLLAPRARSIVGVDRSAAVLRAAERRTQGVAHVRFVEGDMHALPFAEPRFDQVLMLAVLGHSERPGVAIAEGARVLRPGGRLVITALAEHGHPELTRRYAHQNSGFTPAGLRRLMEAAGLSVEHCEVSARESRKPHFEVLLASGTLPVPADPTASP